MTKINSTWLCALLIASGKLDLRDVTPAQLENFDSFIATLPREKLIAFDDALEFAWDAMAGVDGEQAVECVRAIGAMWELVFDLVYESSDVKNSVESLIK